MPQVQNQKGGSNVGSTILFQTLLSGGESRLGELLRDSQSHESVVHCLSLIASFEFCGL